MRPFLSGVTSADGIWGRGAYPFNVPSFQHGIDLHFKSAVTFFVGSNGSGKSTLLEAVADKCGFKLGGGNRHQLYEIPNIQSPLTEVLQLEWMTGVRDGFFLRSETFFNFVDEVQNQGLDTRRRCGSIGASPP